MRPHVALPFALLLLALPHLATATPRQLGLNIHQSPDVGVAVTVACKAHLARIDFNWFSVEVSQGTYDWSVLDAVIDAATARGLTVLATIGYTPAWAAMGGEDAGVNSAVPMPGTYASFVAAAVGRYASKIMYWELWNEPNLSQFFTGTADQYVQSVLLPGAAAVRAGCPSCKVLAPTLATVGSNYADWMKTVLTQAGSSIDIVTGHDYAVFDDMGGGGLSPDFYSKLDHHRVDKVGGTVVFEDPLSLRESMTAYGASDKPLWITETGYEATFGDADAMAAQAHFTSEVLGATISRPWWGATVFYEAFDVAGQPDHWGFSLADPDASLGFDPKPACAVLAAPPDFDASAPPDAAPPPPGDAGGFDAARSRDAALDADGADAASTGSSPGGCSCTMARGAGRPSWVGGLLLVGLAARRRVKGSRDRADLTGSLRP